MPDGAYLSRAADCETVYRDARVFSSDKKVEFRPKYGNTPLYEHHTTSLVFNDPPLHTRVRKLDPGALVPRDHRDGARARHAGRPAARPDGREKRRRRRSDRGFRRRHSGRDHRQLLNVPHADREPLRGWSLEISARLSRCCRRSRRQLGNDVRARIPRLSRKAGRRPKRNPGDPTNDVLTRLIAASSTAKGSTNRSCPRIASSSSSRP